MWSAIDFTFLADLASLGYDQLLRLDLRHRLLFGFQTRLSRDGIHHLHHRQDCHVTAPPNQVSSVVQTSEHGYRRRKRVDEEFSEGIPMEYLLWTNIGRFEASNSFEWSSMPGHCTCFADGPEEWSNNC